MGTLKDLFDLIKNGPQQETSEISDSRIKQLRERLSKSGTLGKSIVDAAIKQGIVFCTDTDMGNKSGAYIPATGMIVLNSNMSDDILLATMVHESRHSLQPHGYSHSDTVKSALTVNRAMEADAMAFECAAVVEMKTSEPGAYKEFKTHHPVITDCYEKELSASKDPFKALGKAFEAWYENGAYVNQYDAAVLNFMSLGSIYRGAYKYERPALEVSEKVCSFFGKSYMPASFFSSSKALTVSYSTAQRGAEIEKHHIRHFLRKPKETSLSLMYVRMPNGEIKTPERLIVSTAINLRKRLER